MAHTHEMDTGDEPASVVPRVSIREWVRDPGGKVTVALGVLAIAYLV